jgi:hypothetical protein
MNIVVPLESTLDAETTEDAVDDTGQKIEPSALPAAYTATLTRPETPADTEIDISPVSEGWVEKMYQWLLFAMTYSEAK